MVEQFHLFARSCDSVERLRSAFDEFRDYLIASFLLPNESKADKLTADIMELTSDGHFNVTAATNPLHFHCAPEMSLRFEEGGKIGKPEPGDGAAPFCVWANREGSVSVIVVPDVRKSTDALHYYESQDVGWYQRAKVANVYKPTRDGRQAPYQSILTAPIMILKLSAAIAEPAGRQSYRCGGVLNITHSSPTKFDPAACAWARASASLVASLYESFLYHLARLGADPPKTPLFSEGASDAVRVSLPKESVADSTATTGSNALRGHRIAPWKNLTRDSYLKQIKVLGDTEQSSILEQLQRLGFVLLRFEGSGPEMERLLSLEQWLGAARLNQNGHAGKIKIISPSEAVAATSGDSAHELGPHVDGTQDPATPTLLVFEYLTTPTYGGTSTFIDLASVLQGFSSAECHELLCALAHPKAARC